MVDSDKEDKEGSEVSMTQVINCKLDKVLTITMEVEV